MRKKKEIEFKFGVSDTLTSKEKSLFRKTKLWTDFRNKIFKDRNHTCEICGYDKRPTLHHIYLNDKAESYTNLSPERFKVCCSGCHKWLHRIERSYHRKKDPVTPDPRIEQIINEFIVLPEVS
jgi:hypothetical protein